MGRQATESQSDKWAIDPDDIIAVAKVIGGISEDLEEKIRANGQEIELDPQHRRGAFYLVPALRALGIELAVKAMQCRVREGATPDKEHDLLKLFEQLPDQVRTELEEAWAKREWPRGEMNTMAYLDMNKLENLVRPRGSRLKEVLKAHRRVFTQWRYGYELLWRWYGRGQDVRTPKRYEFGERSPQAAALRDALKTIVETHCRGRG